MAFIKCKICGGDVEVLPGKNWGTCDYCDSRVTFPKDSTEQRINLLNRADFPTLHVGGKKLVMKQALVDWMRRNTNDAVNGREQ